MQVNDYREFFNNILNNGFFNGGIILGGARIDQKERDNILNEIGYRLQVEYQKKVYVVASNMTVESELPIIYPPYDFSELPKRFDRKNTVFIINTRLPYFQDDDNWETKFINTLIYYFYPFFGFGSSRQLIKVYENV